jgi:hypothetical protein
MIEQRAHDSLGRSLSRVIRTAIFAAGVALVVTPVAALFKALRWRSIGPCRGGGVTAVSGVAGRPLVYYMGTTGGGVWKTEDGGPAL